MARRFRRLRRAAHQVIEVTRSFWRLCLCCGTLRAETSRDVIPVSVALSCTNLPPSRAPLFSWHCCTRQHTRREVDVVDQTSVPSYSGPQNWVSRTDSGIQTVQQMPNSRQSRQDVRGSFSRDYPFTSSSTSLRGGFHRPKEESVDCLNLQAARRLLNISSPGHSTTVPIWSVSGSSQTDDHVPLRFLNEFMISQSPVYSEQSLPRTWGSTNPVDTSRSPSGRLSMDTVGRDYQRNPSQETRPLTPSASLIVTDYASVNNITPSLASVEVPLDIPSPRKTRFQRFEENDKYLGYLPSPSGASLVVSPSPYSRSSKVLPKRIPKVNLVPSTPSSNPIDALRSPSGKLCIDGVGSHSKCCGPRQHSQSESIGMSPKSLSVIGLHGLVESSGSVVCSRRANSPMPFPSGLNSKLGLAGNTANVTTVVSVGINEDSGSAIALPTCSRADPQLRLNLDLLGDSSERFGTSSFLRVEVAIRSEWNEIDPGSWGQRCTIASTTCGTVDVAYCEKFRQRFALKTLPPGTGIAEVDILKKCQGPFVVEMHAVLSQGEEKLLCTSFYARLHLGHWLRKDERRTNFGEKEAALICSYVLTGLEFIHNKGILHLDIKPANILLCAKGYPVIGDFGSAMDNTRNHGVLRHFTPVYASPEVLSGEFPTRQADLWSTACVFYEIVAGRSPYHGKYEVEMELKVLEGSTPDVSMLSIDAQHFICAQLKSDKTDRLGFSFGTREVMRHRVFHQINWDEIKYGHRHYDCELLKVLRVLDKADDHPNQSSTSSIYNNNNSSKWELWSSSEEDSDEEFGFSSRPLCTVEEETDNSEPEETSTRDSPRVLWAVQEEDEEYGGPDGPYEMDQEVYALDDSIYYEQFEDTGAG